MRKIAVTFLVSVLSCALAYGQNGLPGGPGAQIPNSAGVNALSVGATPVSGGSSGQCLFISSGVLSSQACGGAPSGAAGGDLNGTYPNPGVVKINGTALSGLATGLLKNTTATGVPSIAAAADVPVVAAGVAGPLSATDATTTNSRAPSGAAGGSLGGTYPNPTAACTALTDQAANCAGHAFLTLASGTNIDLSGVSTVSFTCSSACTFSTASNVIPGKLYSFCVQIAATNNVTITRGVSRTLAGVDIASIVVTPGFTRSCSLFVGQAPNSFNQMTAFASVQ